MAITLTAAAVLSVLATYGAISGLPPFGPDPQIVLWLLNLNLVLVLALGFVVVRRLVEVWAARRRGLAGSKLHIRLVMLFGAVAVMPAIVVAVFSALFLNIGVQGWFAERVRTALESSRAVAEAYLHEHTQAIRADILAMAADLNRDSAYLLVNPQRLSQAVVSQAALRSLTEAVVFDSAGRLLARSGIVFALEFEPIPFWAMDQANNGDVAILTSDADDRVRALVRLDAYGGAFLYVGRQVDARVVSYVEQTRRAVQAYQNLQGQQSGLQITFSMVFVVLALLLLLAAAWIGLAVANKLARPISQMVAAAEMVRAGDLSARLPDVSAGDELGSLARAFNRMTSQLESQRGELVEANRLLDQRRRFTETVLAGVSAGVIGMDASGRITLTNRSAAELLGVELDRHIGDALVEVVPDMVEVLDMAFRRPERRNEAQIKLTAAGRTRTLLARVTAEQADGEVRGYVVTFDDVTELMAAQRTAAWADVARRIAHEIKNPLTPIQLSAERLKRKYLKQIETDPETFVACTDTIVRQVGDIGRMVDEFSAFARMPAPVVKPEKLNELVREAVFLQRNGNPKIRFDMELPDQPVLLGCDRRQISQALINLLQNAADAIDGREGQDLPAGHIIVRLQQNPNATIIQIDDNGKGLPVTGRERLTEPYVTTRAKGTGLGLAIVKKIMEDHAGELRLEDAPTGGARVTMVLSGGDVPLAVAEGPAAQAVTIHGA